MIRRIALFVIAVITQYSLLQAQEKYSVEFFGALRSTIIEGDISAQADLSEFMEIENFYALGAFEDLKGEILIMGPETYSVRATDGEIAFIDPYTEKANLLVTATVPEWREVVLDAGTGSMDELQHSIENIAREEGLNLDEPFPFIIEGSFKELKWHIIDWPKDDPVHTHQKHRTSGPHGTIHDQPVKILGFWSDAHHGIFTHHSTNMHLHFVTQDGEVAGHVDGLNDWNELRIFIPG